MTKAFIAFVVAYIMTISTEAQIISGNNSNFVPPEQTPLGIPTDYGYENKVIARWITPPFETINTTTRTKRY